MYKLIPFLSAVLGRSRREDTGATAVEYGLLVGLIAVAIIVVVGLLGGQLQDMFQGVVDALGGDGGGGD